MGLFEEIVIGRATKVTDFLVAEEKFKADTWHGENCLRRVISGELYSCWVIVYSDRIQVYTEFSVGGQIDDREYWYDGNDFDNFLENYKKSLEHVKAMLA